MYILCSSSCRFGISQFFHFRKKGNETARNYFLQAHGFRSCCTSSNHLDNLLKHNIFYRFASSHSLTWIGRQFAELVIWVQIPVGALKAKKITLTSLSKNHVQLLYSQKLFLPALQSALHLCIFCLYVLKSTVSLSLVWQSLLLLSHLHDALFL
jgi:hypothetical protein